MKSSLWDDNYSAYWEINQQQQKTQEGSDLQGWLLKFMNFNTEVKFI